jgi:hypothetical protein
MPEWRGGEEFFEEGAKEESNPEFNSREKTVPFAEALSGACVFSGFRWL